MTMQEKSSRLRTKLKVCNLSLISGLQFIIRNGFGDFFFRRHQKRNRQTYKLREP